MAKIDLKHGKRTARKAVRAKRGDNFDALRRELAFGLSACSSLNQAFELIMRAMLGLPGIEAAGIYLAEDGALRLAAHEGPCADLLKRSGRFGGNTPLGRAILKGTTFAQKTMAVAPIGLNGRTIAGLGACSRGGQSFPRPGLSRLERLADGLGPILERIRLGDADRETRRNLESLFEGVDDLILVIDRDGRIIHANSAAGRSTGFPVEELIGMPIAALHPPGQAAALIEAVDGMFAGESGERRLSIRRKEGGLIPAEMRGVKGRWGGREVVFGITRDVTERARREEELIRRSITDSLTKIHNRAYFFERAVQEISKCARGKGLLSIAVIDIDHFKSVNDSFGHQAGDAVLAEFASILQAGIRKYDVLARYGGEEFAIILADARKADALRILARIQAKTAGHRFRHAMQSMSITFSCGLADTTEFQTDQLTLEAIIKLADDRQYFAKMQGRNRIVI